MIISLLMGYDLAMSGFSLFLLSGLVLLRKELKNAPVIPTYHPPSIFEEPVDLKRRNATKASIRLRWALAYHSHPLSTLRMHASYRALNIPRDERPKNISELTKHYAHYTFNLNEERHFR